MVSILHFITDPCEEVYLASLLRMPLFRRSYERLYELKDERGIISLPQIKKIEPELYTRITELISASFYASPSVFIRRLYEILNVFEAYPGKQEVLIEFYECAYNFENTAERITLNDFLRYLEENRAILSLRAGTEHGVTVQTIHSSKGLEYHTVIIPFLSQSFDFRLDGSLMFSRNNEGRIDQYAIAARNYVDYFPDQEGISRVQSETALNYRIDELNALYVALTRACENLLILPLGMKNRKTVGAILIEAVFSRYSTGKLPLSIGEPVKSTHEIKSREKLFSAVHRPEEAELKTAVLSDRKVDAGTFASEPGLKRVGLLKGLIFHRAIEKIKRLPVDEQTIEKMLRAAAAQEGSEYTGFERNTALDPARDTVLKVIADERLAKYFSRGAYSELIIFSERFQNLVGRIDRMVIGSEIEVIDFKTNAVEHDAQLHQLVELYTDQVTLYCSTVSKVFPGKPVRGYLYFTEADYEKRFVSVYDGG